MIVFVYIILEMLPIVRRLCYYLSGGLVVQSHGRM